MPSQPGRLGVPRHAITCMRKTVYRRRHSNIHRPSHRRQPVAEMPMQMGYHRGSCSDSIRNTAGASEGEGDAPVALAGTATEGVGKLARSLPHITQCLATVAGRFVQVHMGRLIRRCGCLLPLSRVPTTRVRQLEAAVLDVNSCQTRLVGKSTACAAMAWRIPVWAHRPCMPRRACAAGMVAATSVGRCCAAQQRVLLMQVLVTVDQDRRGVTSRRSI